jgi:hypothetical protein
VTLDVLKEPNNKDSKDLSTQNAKSTEILQNLKQNENREEGAVKSASTATLKNSGETSSNLNTQNAKNLSCSDYLLNEDINREQLCKK